MTSVIADDSFALHARAQLYRLVFVVQHVVRQDFQLLSRFIQLKSFRFRFGLPNRVQQYQVQVFRVGQNGFAEINRTVHHRLFLLAF